MVNERGIWITSDNNHHLVDESLVFSIKEFLKKEKCKSVVDLGCGNGFYTKVLKEDFICDGFDGNPYTEILSDGLCSQLDLSLPVDLNFLYDWVLCLEVGEHIPVQYEDIFINNIHNSNTKGIIISWATPGQDGLGHYNGREQEYLKNVFNNLGYSNDIEVENELRKNSEFWWFKNNIMVFRKNMKIDISSRVIPLDKYKNYNISDVCSMLYDLNFVKVENDNCELILTMYKIPLELIESNKQITIGFNVFDENQVVIWNDSMVLPNNWSKAFIKFNANINYEILINGVIVEKGNRLSGEVELFRNFVVDDLLFLYENSVSPNVIAPLALSSTSIPICPKDVISDTLSINNNISPFILSKEWELMVDSVTENGINLELYSWPLVTDTFCKKLIEDAESYGKWTSGRHDYYPTHDILLSDIGYDIIYSEILNEYAHPTARWIWNLEGSNWDNMKVESFIVKYDNASKDAQNSLSLHHDHADYTFVVGLNDEYSGGGTWFPRQKYLIDKSPGVVTVHPTITHRHGARPVTDGVRYVLISFCRKG